MLLMSVDQAKRTSRKLRNTVKKAERKINRIRIAKLVERAEGHVRHAKLHGKTEARTAICFYDKKFSPKKLSEPQRELIGRLKKRKYKVSFRKDSWMDSLGKRVDWHELVLKW